MHSSHRTQLPVLVCLFSWSGPSRSFSLCVSGSPYRTACWPSLWFSSPDSRPSACTLFWACTRNIGINQLATLPPVIFQQLRVQGPLLSFSPRGAWVLGPHLGKGLGGRDTLSKAGRLTAQPSAPVNVCGNLETGGLGPSTGAAPPEPGERKWAGDRQPTTPQRPAGTRPCPHQSMYSGQSLFVIPPFN